MKLKLILLMTYVGHLNTKYLKAMYLNNFFYRQNLFVLIFTSIVILKNFYFF